MSEAATNKKTPIYKVLYFQVICAIVIGIVLGAVWPEVGEKMKPFGDGFIRLIKMIIAPVIFCTVVTGIAGMENMKKVGKTGGLALLYFEVVSTIALIIGLVIVNVVEPGSGMHVDPATLDQSAVSAYTGPGKMQTTTQFLMNVIPSTVVGAFAQGDILQVLFFSILFGFALHKFGGRGTLVFDLIEKSSQILFQIVGMIMRVAPIGAFGAMAFTIGKYGIASLLPLAKLMGTFYATCLLFIFIVLGAICRIHGFSVMRYIAYIKEELQDQERYQTVYSKVLGSAAAPTAGLHFTPELLEKIRAKGVKIGYVTLHVGLGTFRPVKEDTIEDHPMHSEYCTIPQETADLINETRANGGRCICVGTTSCRTLESWAAEDGHMEAKSGWTDIYIYPGYKFKVMDGLVTNFHLPESTLIMLIAAFYGYDKTMAAYKVAVEEKYRFFSFGDAMFIR